MTDKNSQSRLYDITLPLESKVGGGVSAYKTQLRNGNYFSHETTNPLVVNIEWMVEDIDIFRQMKEIARGGINIVHLSCLNFEELVHIQNMRGREIGIDSWQVQGEFNLVGTVWNWIVSGEELPTSWDELDSCTDGDFTTLVNYSAEGGVTDGGDYIQATAGAQLIAGYPWWNTYSIKVDVYVATGAAGDQGEVLLRKQSAKASDTLFYRLLIDPEDDEVRFEYVSGVPATTVLETWSKTLTNATYYTLMVVARGNRFDCYIDGEHLHPPVFDDRLVCGYYGLMAVSDTCRFDNLMVKQIKPVGVWTPVGMYDINQMVIAGSGILDDDTVVEGSIKTIIDPTNPVKFRQVNTDGSGLNESVSIDVKVWDTMRSAVESNWVKADAIDHPFEGDMVIDNGLIRLSFAGQTYIKSFTMSVYSDGSWEDVSFNPSWSSLDFENVDYGITVLEKHRVTVREAGYHQTGTGMDITWTDYTIRSGSAMMYIENRRAL